MDVQVKEVLGFLQIPKERKDVEKQFELSNSQSWHLLAWMEKANLINVTRVVIAGRGGVVFTYKARRKV